MDGILLRDKDVASGGKLKQNIEIEHEQNRAVLVWTFHSASSLMNVNMIKKDAVPNTISLVQRI
jgi:hypothetical protein